MPIALAQLPILYGATPFAHCPLPIATLNTTVSPFPISDWQFWAATLMATVAMGWLVRAIVPWRRILRQSPKKPGRRATLTLERKPLDGSRKGLGGSKGGSGCH